MGIIDSIVGTVVEVATNVATFGAQKIDVTNGITGDIYVYVDDKYSEFNVVESALMKVVKQDFTGLVTAIASILQKKSVNESFERLKGHKAELKKLLDGADADSRRRFISQMAPWMAKNMDVMDRRFFEDCFRDVAVVIRPKETACVSFETFANLLKVSGRVARQGQIPTFQLTVIVWGMQGIAQFDSFADVSWNVGFRSIEPHDDQHRAKTAGWIEHVEM